MTAIVESIICSDNTDVPRFIQFFEDSINQDLIERTKTFDTTKKHIRLLPDEKAEAKQEKQKMKAQKQEKANKGGASDMAGLEAMILAKRENAMGGFMSYMENKYAGD
jgi:hypothetical protein